MELRGDILQICYFTGFSSYPSIRSPVDTASVGKTQLKCAIFAVGAMLSLREVLVSDQMDLAVAGS